MKKKSKAPPKTLGQLEIELVKFLDKNKIKLVPIVMLSPGDIRWSLKIEPINDAGPASSAK